MSGLFSFSFLFKVHVEAHCFTCISKFNDLLLECFFGGDNYYCRRVWGGWDNLHERFFFFFSISPVVEEFALSRHYIIWELSSFSLTLLFSGKGLESLSRRINEIKTNKRILWIFHEATCSKMWRRTLIYIYRIDSRYIITRKKCQSKEIIRFTLIFLSPCI